jgi:hypothetical protein
MLLKIHLAALAAPEELEPVAVAADTRTSGPRRDRGEPPSPYRHAGVGERWGEALAVLNMVEAMHRAYVNSLRPLARRRRR